MSSDISISIGLDLSEAVKGRDQLLALNTSISSSLDGLVNKAKASSQGLGGAFTSSMATGKKALDDYDKASAAVMAGEVRRSQQMAKAAQDQENAAKRLLSSYAPLAAESERLARDQETLNNLIAQGGPKTQQYQTALANLQQRQAFIATESGRMASGAALSANQMRNLSYQINDVVSGLLMGQSPWQIFTQQAGQFAQIAQDANFKMTGLRWGILGVGVAGAATFGAIGVHLYQLSNQLKTLTGQAAAFNSAMTGAGSMAGANALATQGPFSRGEMTTAMSELMRYRTLSAEVVRSISRASVPMAEATGKSPDEVVRQLADASKGGYDGIMKLQDAYGMLTPEQVKHARLLTEQGQQAEAARIAVDALQSQMSKAAVEIRGPITDAWIGFGNSYTKMLDSVVESPGFKRFEKMAENLVRQAGVAMEIGAYINNRANAPATELRFEMPPAPGATASSTAPQAGVKSAEQIRAEADTNKATELSEQYQKQIAALRSLDATARMAAEVKQAADEKFRNIDNSDKQKAAYISGEMGRRQAEAAREIAVIQFSVDAAQKQADTLQNLGRVEALKRAAQDQARTESFSRPTDVAARQKQILSGQEAQARGALAGQNIDYGIQVAGLEKITAAQTAGTRAQQEAERQVKVLAATEAYINAARAANVPVNDNLIKQYENISRAELEAKQSADAWNATMQGSASVNYRVQIQNLKDMEAQMRAFGATEEEIAQLYVDAELRKLEASRNWADGAEGALKRYVNNAQNAGARAGQFVASGMRSAEDALVDFSMGTKTASQAFRDFASSVVKDLIRMQMQAAMAQAVGSSGGGGSGLFGLLGSAFSMGASYFSGGGTESAASLYGGGSYEGGTAYAQSTWMNSSMNTYASGTDYAPPGMALVGENGPELMQMKGGERIYPNDQTKAILSPKATNDNAGSGGGSINFAVSVDARGSTDPAAVENAARRASEEVFAKHAPSLIERASNRALSKNGELMMRGGRYARAVRGGNAS